MRRSLPKIWIFPLFFAVLAAVAGLLIRYAYAGYPLYLNLKNVLHAHSHVMLLGFLFNAFYLLLIRKFRIGFDKISKRIFIFMQLCVLLLFGAFLYQGYAFWSILFSTLHLWSSYWLLIRLWKNSKGIGNGRFLIRSGIVFHFISSIGPYTLGPLMVLGLKETPWYQQSVFFYLHFQFFGTFFLWFFALFLRRMAYGLPRKLAWFLIFGVILIYAHSLDFSFDHPAINLVGGLGSVALLAVTGLLYKTVLKKDNPVKWLYMMLIIIALGNLMGSYPFYANLATHNRFILIAWLHLIFLGLYTPAIWVFTGVPVRKQFWYGYAFFIILSEVFLIFPTWSERIVSVPVNQLLLISYLGITAFILLLHGKWILSLEPDKK